MKISFPKYALRELLTRKRSATWFISFAGIALFAGVCGSYLLGNKWWLLTITLIGIAGVLLCLAAAAVTFLNQGEVREAPIAPIEQEVPLITPQWDYRPKEAIRGRTALDSSCTETSDGLSSDPFGTNDNVWFNNNSLEGAIPTFVSGPPETEEPITKALPQTTDSVGGTPTVDDATVSRYD